MSGTWRDDVGKLFDAWSIKHNKAAVYKAESYDKSHGF
jgi:hypothetical protein